MYTELPPDVAVSFPPRVCNALGSAMRQLYDSLPTVDELPALQMSACYGTNLYHSFGVELAGEMAERGVGLTVKTVHQAHVFFVQGAEHLPFTIHRVGSARETEIISKFPRNYRAGLSHYARGQGVLFADLEQHDVSLPLVLAHVGNEDDGLLQLHLCRPSVIAEGKVAAWEFAFPIIGGESRDDYDYNTWGPPPTPEAVPVPAVLPRDQEEHGAG